MGVQVFFEDNHRSLHLRHRLVLGWRGKRSCSASPHRTRKLAVLFGFGFFLHLPESLTTHQGASRGHLRWRSLRTLAASTKLLHGGRFLGLRSGFLARFEGGLILEGIFNLRDIIETYEDGLFTLLISFPRELIVFAIKHLHWRVSELLKSCFRGVLPCLVERGQTILGGQNYLRCLFR